MEANLEQILERQHNAADTSVESFIALCNEGELIREKKECYEAIKIYGPITSRRLAEVTKKERTNITRSIYDLQNEIHPAVKVAFKKKCPVTGKNVRWYVAVDWQPPQLEQSSFF